MKRHCCDCAITYPIDCGSALHLHDGLTGEYQCLWLCGICALARVNAIHGIKRTRFNGGEAEATRQRAIEYRKLGHLP